MNDTCIQESEDNQPASDAKEAFAMNRRLRDLDLDFARQHMDLDQTYSTKKRQLYEDHITQRSGIQKDMRKRMKAVVVALCGGEGVPSSSPLLTRIHSGPIIDGFAQRLSIVNSYKGTHHEVH